MPKGNHYANKNAPPAEQTTVVTRLVPFDTSFLVEGATGVGFGTIPLQGFPEGNLLFFGAVISVIFAGSGADAGLADTWEGDFALGTTPLTDGTLTAGDVDLIPSTATATAVAEVAPVARGVSAVATSGTVHDNTANTLEMNLNLLIDDADISADDVPITAKGWLRIVYVVLGDD